MYFWVFVGVMVVVCVIAEIAYKIEMKSYKESLQSDKRSGGNDSTN